jgi:hypothetical protein
MAPFINPTHKRTEGRAPVLVSEFTKKVATIQADSAEIAATPNVKLWVLVVVVTDLGRATFSGTADLNHLFDFFFTFENNIESTSKKNFLRNFDPVAEVE